MTRINMLEEAISKPEIGQKLLEYMGLEPFLRLRELNRNINKTANECAWKRVTDEHYQLDNFELLLVKNIEKIRELHIVEGPREITTTHIQSLIKGLVQLDKVYIRYFTDRKLVREMVTGLCEKFKQTITYIQLRMVDVGVGFNEDINSAAAKNAAANKGNKIFESIAELSNLRTLQLQGIHIYPDVIDRLVKTSKSDKLEEIEIDTESYLTADTVKTINTRYGARLRKLGLSRLVDSGLSELEMLLQKAQGLTHLVVGGIYSNSGAVLKNITPKHLPKLQSLELREHSTPGQFNSFLNQNWESITQLSTFAFLMPPETSKIIGASFKNLQSLNFTEIQMITPENMNLILKSYSKQLEKIQLCACGIDISEAWSPDLEWKRLKRATLVNTGITTAMLESLLTSEMLNEIEIAASALSDEKELLKLLESPKSNLLTKNLEVLIIRGLNGLSARGVKALIERFKMSLHEVEIAGIDISKKECQMLREKYGTISFFFASDQHMPPEMMEALQRMQEMEMEGHEHGGGGGGCCGGHGMPAMSNNNPLMAMLGQGMMGGPSLADGEIDVISGVQFANPLSKSPQLKEVRMSQAGSNEGSWEDENMSDEEGGINDVD